MNREVPCVTLWVTSQSPDELANAVQTRRGRNGYGIAWVFFGAESVARFGLHWGGWYRTTNGRAFEWLAATSEGAASKAGRRVPRRLTSREARKRVGETMKKHGVGKFRGARP